MVRRVRVGEVQTDLRIQGGRIVAIGTAPRRSGGEDELDGRSGAVLPGLHDHHLHLRALAAAARSVPIGPPDVDDHVGLAAAIATAAATRPPGAWLRGVGYHDSVAGALDRHALDRLAPDHPLRVQHRSGALWVVNSLGLARLGADADDATGIERDADGRPTGRLWRMDGWLASRLGPADTPPADGAALAALSAAGVAAGVTGWTDATPGRSAGDARALADAAAAGVVRQRLHLMVSEETDPATVADVEEVAGVTAGPVKVMLDDAHLPSLDELTGLIARAHRLGRPVAVHCVTRVQMVLTLTALELAGAAAGDRIEHGAIVPAELIPRLAASGITVITQPNFVHQRGDQYLAEVPAADRTDLWRARSLMEGGVAVAAGTDAPFGSADPWLAIRAAWRRRTSSGRVLGSAEAVGWPVAALVGGLPRRPGPTPAHRRRRTGGPDRARRPPARRPRRRRAGGRGSDDHRRRDRGRHVRIGQLLGRRQPLGDGRGSGRGRDAEAHPLEHHGQQRPRPVGGTGPAPRRHGARPGHAHQARRPDDPQPNSPRQAGRRPRSDDDQQPTGTQADTHSS